MNRIRTFYRIFLFTLLFLLCLGFSSCKDLDKIRNSGLSLPEVEIRIGPRLMNGELADENAIMGITDIWCVARVRKAEPEILTSFLDRVSLNIAGEASSLLVLSEDSEKEILVSEDGREAAFSVRVAPAAKENEDAAEVVLRAVDEAGNLWEERTVPVSSGAISVFAYRSNGSQYMGNTPNSDVAGTAEHEFYYSDDFFYRNPEEYDNALAVLSLGLEATSYSSPVYDDKYAEELPPEDRAENVLSALHSLDFTNIETYHFETPLSDSSDKAAFVLATRYIGSLEENDTLIAVVIRGGGYGAEWASNFRIGDGNSAAGFATAAEEIETKVRDYINRVCETGAYTGQIKLWITGFSRSAAIANLLTHELNQKGEGVEQDNIYAYTIATPNVCRDPGREDRNLFNIISPNDLIPQMPLSTWGFSRYGRTLILPVEDNPSVNDRYRVLTGDLFDGSNQAELIMDFITSFGELVPLSADYYTKAEDTVIQEFIKRYAEGYGDMQAAFVSGLVKSFNVRIITRLLKIKDARLSGTHKPEHYLSWLEGGGVFLSDVPFSRMTGEEKAEVEQKLTVLIVDQEAKEETAEKAEEKDNDVP